MSRRSLTGTLAAACLLPGGVSGQWVHEAEVRSTIEAWRASWHVPGAAVAVMRDGEVLLLDGFGVKRIEDEEPIDAETLFELGSASKTFAATTAALAVGDGLISWNTALIDLLPRLRLHDPWVERRVTVLDALTHRGGLGRNDLLWLGGAAPRDILGRLRHVPLSAGFREEFSYSNVMYIVAGEAIGAAFGQPWADVLHERIFTRLGMRSSRLGEGETSGNVAVPHVQLGDSVLPATTPHTHVGPAGGILASASDLIAWMRFHLAAEGAVRELQEPRVRLPLGAFGAQYARSSRLAYGTGWFVSDYAGRPMVDHIGGHGGMVARVTLLPEQAIGVAVLTNHGDNLLPVAITHRVLDLLLDLEERLWNDTLLAFWENVREARLAAALAPGGERVRTAPARLVPGAYAGTYVSGIYGDTRVAESRGGLVLTYGSTLVGTLSHWHHDTFRITWKDPFMRAILGPGFATFHLDMRGRPSGITWTGFQGERVEAERVRRGATASSARSSSVPG